MAWNKIKEAELIVATRDLSVALEHTRRAPSLAPKMQSRALGLERPLRAESLGLLDDDRAFHDRVKCTRIGKISCLLKGMLPSGIRGD